MNFKTKKAQAWGVDLIVASIIFIIGILSFYLYAINTPQELKTTIEKLSYQGDVIANSLLSEGYPQNWDEENVLILGILSENKINKTKLERFYNITLNNYEKTKFLFNTNYNYYVKFQENITINSNSINGIGKSSENAADIIKVSRIIVYNDKPSTLEIEVWK